MPKMSWPLFTGRHPHCHLVVGQVKISIEDDFGTPHLRRLKAQVSRLLDRLGLAGDHSVAIVRATGTPEVHAAFETRRDADRVAAVVNARIVGQVSDQASRQEFVLDDATTAAIDASLATEGELDER
jgi:hypothetical protein